MRHGSSRNITRISRGGDAPRMELKHPGNSGEIPARGLLFPHHWTRAMRLIACSALETNWNKIKGAWHSSLVYLVSCGTTALWTSPSEHKKPSRRFGCLSHWTHVFVLFYCTYWKNFGPDCSVNQSFVCQHWLLQITYILSLSSVWDSSTNIYRVRYMLYRKPFFKWSSDTQVLPLNEIVFLRETFSNASTSSF
jgi:hypothetical protein